MRQIHKEDQKVTILPNRKNIPQAEVIAGIIPELQLVLSKK
jgi:hypothetical protein